MPHSEAAVLKVLRLKSATANHSGFPGTFVADRRQNVRSWSRCQKCTARHGIADWVATDALIAVFLSK
jgi:hypothetical protein